jgi:predicted HicB family RNase H-like nuclease
MRFFSFLMSHALSDLKTAWQRERSPRPSTGVTVAIAIARASSSGVNHYTYRVEWSPDYDEYLGCCLELPFVQERAATAHDALTAVTAAVDQRVAEMRESDQTPPEPLSERRYTGTFVVRTSRQLHARLAREALEEHVSMNQWVVQKLSGREMPSIASLFD